MKSNVLPTHLDDHRATPRHPSADRLIVFARFPEPGRVKTRMIPALGADQSTRLHVALAHQTLTTVRRLMELRPCNIEVQVAGGNLPEMQQLFGAHFSYVEQVGADLGERLNQAVHSAFEHGVQRVVVIGADCPGLEPSKLQEAFAALDQVNLVLGPALDGGYYLIGLKKNRSELFRDIAWGTERVLEQTLAAAQKLKLNLLQLSPLSDVDHPEDLIVCRQSHGICASAFPPAEPGLLSVVIPTLNEESRLASCLEQLAEQPELEVLVADGGSQDRTVEVAQQYGVRVVPARPGRSRQMNAGAALARGEILLFLHADSRLPHDFRQQIRQVLDQGACAGAFRLHIDSQRLGLRCVEWGANFRSRHWQLPYGDQGLFLRASLFYELGGFPQMPLMEDFEFCRRLRRLGKIQLAASAITTSPRRWNALGIIRTTLINQLCIAGYLLGVPPVRLASWYAARR